MKTIVIFGAGYSDEGKGICLKRLSNLLAAQNLDFVVQRVNAGSNAGHKITTQDGYQYISKMMPSAFASDRITLGIGPQVVINLDIWLDEIFSRPDVFNLLNRTFVHGGAAIVLPGYIAKNKGDAVKAKYGTTNQGTSIVVSERINRRAVLLWDLDSGNEEAVTCKMNRSYSELQIVRDDVLSEAKYLISKWRQIKEIIGHNSLSSYQSRILSSPSIGIIEGCNGVLIDTLWGQVPFTTSCMTHPSALLAYSGWPLRSVDRVIGVMGAYLCCLDSRTFPTEFDAITDIDIINRLTIAANEIDTAEDKPRRLGWFDAVAMRSALRDASEVFLTKLDALSGLDAIQVCTHYQSADGSMIDIIPLATSDVMTCRPVYVTLAGWQQSLNGVRDRRDLPQPAIDYVDYLANLLHVKVTYVGTGRREGDFIEWI